MNEWAVYTTDGRIDRVYSGIAVEALMQPHNNEQVTQMPEGLDDSTAYVVDASVQPKQPMSLITTNNPLIADGTDEVIISGIPSGVQVEWPDGQIDIVNGDEVGFKVDLAGFHTFKFTAVPYLDKEITVEAIAAT